jgi:hypothetical protein
MVHMCITCRLTTNNIFSDYEFSYKTKEEANKDLVYSSDECVITTIQSTTLCSIWNKAADLLRGKKMIPVPWMTETKACLIKNSPSEQPHLVTASSSHYKCDDKFLVFKGYSCSQDNSDLIVFIH